MSYNPKTPYSRLVVILGDQLNSEITSLNGFNPNTDLILMAEVTEEASYVPHHKKKLAFVFSAMRHFAEEQRALGRDLRYVKLEEENNSGTIRGEVQRLLALHSFNSITIAQPSEYRLLREVNTWQKDLKIEVKVVNDNRFLTTPQEFSAWAKGRKQLRMEYFYRQMRLRYNILIEDGKPVGGKWNYDTSNRKFPNAEINIPAPLAIRESETTKEVKALVARNFSSNFGDLDPFNLAVTREEALATLRAFINDRLAHFGDYQDAMLSGEPWMFHSLISSYLNCGLLMPLECIRAAEQAYANGTAPLNAVEGFIRQILGWREYVRGYYWLKMPSYAMHNFLDANRDLPQFYWDAKTDLNCVRQCVESTKQHAYTHHIQRLMVLGNFALLTALEPTQVNRWFLLVYTDAYEWAELPNVSGMALYADGGKMSSKPYAASGSYINKMSNYCSSCRYNPKQRVGLEACPFNYLYWDFIARNANKLSNNPRMAMIYKTHEKLGQHQLKAIRNQSKIFLNQLDGP